MSAGLIKFNEFVLDCNRYELLRAGHNVKLEKIPMELLILLVGKNGHLVTREEIVEHLWGKNVFLDTEHGINTAIRKIRQALRDSPEQARFVQTVSGKGYRFVGERQNGNAGTSAAIVAKDEQQTSESLASPKANAPYWHLAAIGTLAVVLLAGAVLAFNLGGLRARLSVKNQIGPIHSIAVLPLANLSGDPSQDYFADGMTDELITALAKNRSLRVVSRTSAMQYRGVSRPLPDIARQLGVDGVLEGSVERSATRVHMTVQLIYAPSDTHVWAESYDRDLNEVVSLPSELSQTIAKEVKIAISPGSPQRYISSEAHDAYLRGRYFWFGGNYPRSQEYFEKAIQLQPDYAAAWSGLADSYAVRAVRGESPPQAVMGKSEAAARKAVELDDSLPEAHNSMAAFYLYSSWDWQRAESESLSAIELDPNYAEGHHLRSYVLRVLNRDDEAFKEQKRSTEIDPFARPWALGAAYIKLRRYDEAINELRVRADILPDDSSLHFLLSEAYWLKGMWKQSEQELEKGYRLIGDPKMADAEHRAFERGGEKGVEQLGVNEVTARARKQYVSPWDIAFQYAFLGDKEQTLKFLEDAYRERSPWLVSLQKEPVLDFLHSDQRYRALVKKIALPPAY